MKKFKEISGCLQIFIIIGGLILIYIGVRIYKGEVINPPSDYKIISTAEEYVNMMVHTNNIECFWSHLKRGVDGIYHWVSKKHLQSYIDEFSLRYNTRKGLTSQRFDLILCNTIGRLTYKQLIAK